MQVLFHFKLLNKDDLFCYATQRAIRQEYTTFLSFIYTHLPENSIFRIITGAPLPLGAVIMVEDTCLMSTI
jgi:hypothetical protein